MTNLEKMKKRLIDRINGMDAQAFEDDFGDSEHFTTCRIQHGETCPYKGERFPLCYECCIEWLNKEADDGVHSE